MSNSSSEIVPGSKCTRKVPWCINRCDGGGKNISRLRCRSMTSLLHSHPVGLLVRSGDSCGHRPLCISLDNIEDTNRANDYTAYDGNADTSGAFRTAHPRILQKEEYNRPLPLTTYFPVNGIFSQNPAAPQQLLQVLGATRSRAVFPNLGGSTHVTSRPIISSHFCRSSPSAFEVPRPTFVSVAARVNSAAHPCR